jgi:hypothetical protein
MIDRIVTIRHSIISNDEDASVWKQMSDESVTNEHSTALIL